MAPKAFISHASEDKPRFVLAFATLLRELGVDAWLDNWEMQPGDSLVDRIFEEGIKNADAFVIVLSANSVGKPWVREELNAGFVNRVNGQCKLIPVVIDECEVPECLKSTLWERFESLTDIRAKTQRIANAVHGTSEKPPVGPTPRYATTALDVYPDLTREDHVVLTTACELSMAGGWPTVSPETIWPLLIEQGLTDDMIRESIQVLENNYYISATWALGGALAVFDVLPSAFDTFLRATMADYSLVVDTICLQILNHNARTSVEIQASTQFPVRVVNHLMGELESRSLITVTHAMGGTIHILSVSPELSRRFRNR